LELTGILLVDKPAGFTSFDVVAKLRGIAKMRKIGHAGTLDPAATGLLPVFLGSATRFIDLLPDQDKRYTATFLLGITTDTQDMTGNVLSTRPVRVSAIDVTTALARFVGKIQQIPPMYSAVKHQGKRLYDLARQGIEVERKPREIEIRAITMLAADEPAGRYTIDVECSKGSYIRTLCHDLGEELGCGGALEVLRRTQACGFSLKNAYTLDDLQTLADRGELAGALSPVESALAAYPRLTLDTRQAGLFANGQRLALSDLSGPALQSGERIAVFGPQSAFLGLAHAEGGLLRHIRQLPR